MLLIFFIFLPAMLDVFVCRISANPRLPYFLQKWLKFAKKCNICNKAYKLFISEQNHRTQKARRSQSYTVTQVSSVF